MILSCTGHRPERLGGYGHDVWMRLLDLSCEFLSDCSPTCVISGMALGWDQAMAYSCIIKGIPFVAAIPFIGQDASWPTKSRDLYNEILGRSREIHVVSKSRSKVSFMKRNMWMVDHSDTLVALWDGSYDSGTGHCVRYAIQKDIPVHNLWSEFSVF